MEDRPLQLTYLLSPASGFQERQQTLIPGYHTPVLLTFEKSNMAEHSSQERGEGEEGGCAGELSPFPLLFPFSQAPAHGTVLTTRRLCVLHCMTLSGDTL